MKKIQRLCQCALVCALVCAVGVVLGACDMDKSVPLPSRPTVAELTGIYAGIPNVGGTVDSVMVDANATGENLKLAIYWNNSGPQSFRTIVEWLCANGYTISQSETQSTYSARNSYSAPTPTRVNVSFEFGSGRLSLCFYSVV